MTEFIYSPLTHMRVADALIPTLRDPHHRSILENYRRHALLEVAGRWEEILAPDMTVDHPVYRFSVGGKTRVLNGRDAVTGFYRSTAEAGENVFGPVDQIIAVADWGFAAEALFQWRTMGAALIAKGDDVRPDRAYKVEWKVASIWRYTPDVRLIGEHIYEEVGSRVITECDPATIVTPSMAAEMLAPLL